MGDITEVKEENKEPSKKKRKTIAEKLKEEKALIDINIESEYVEFQRYLKRYNKVKYQHIMPDVNIRLEPVVAIMQQEYKGYTQPMLLETENQLKAIIKEFNELAYGDDSKINEIEAEILSEALYMMRRTKDIITDEITVMKRLDKPVQTCWTTL